MLSRLMPRALRILVQCAFSDYEQTKFDDDSNMHARLERWAAGSEARSKRLMLRRRKLFDVEEGFQPEKRRVMEAVESVLALWTRCMCMLARNSWFRFRRPQQPRYATASVLA